MSDAKENGDMGPFAGMDAALERAITNYGTPPRRETVMVTVRDFGHHMFDRLPDTLNEWLGWLAELRAEVPEEYRDQLACVLEWESGHYDSGDDASFRIWYERPETDAEMIERVNRGIAYVREGQAKERATYEALKKKFESG